MCPSTAYEQDTASYQLQPLFPPGGSPNQLLRTETQQKARHWCGLWREVGDLHDDGSSLPPLPLFGDINPLFLSVGPSPR